ncbi:DegT/DnrJ/EryC1/StrS family aminotransferase [Chitinophaga ginsengisegetis]|uniref:DegT/DnrJ/EryC1/StrS family aminotransferase n=1 Tax=Chitinophaga ginsengisegetis TaxID=393003 RepID=UPI000DBAC71E|nr:DegT/DnrJ/EryC1/StrS family aminotransferase [Chitinophaga ginsengisegetis]MDR6566547.1 dTDP-4-amino-4,6-dideoxygalactose transaminase [Chitinophaga ginsengisegetis]MDR6646277.1 dTDP-4-amino-4,6-dideoxygalactose transaminase [Chitinophaga ginsengisegetis]MDR6651130.1 dTDP-4-amino-4,6-dideoxygalactose transaminase [Chitinophaga ginsengisegetis]
MEKIQMVDLKSQYLKIKSSIDSAIADCIDTTAFINGPQVKQFTDNLSAYLDVPYVIACANGTDALQIAMMALGLERGDEVIVPSFTYVATAEVIGLLGLVPVMVDVDPSSFNITADIIKTALSPRTKAIVPVHLFGQCADMTPIMQLAKEHGLYVIEDTAQALGADYFFADGRKMKAGTIGNIGTTSFFPSKNLGCYGDGGALYTRNKELADKIGMIANHGQIKKYVHKYIGVNSRLDTLQAAILNVKLTHLDSYANARQEAAKYYDTKLGDVSELSVPSRSEYSSHVFHQYTLKVKDNKRNELKTYLESKGIPAMIYYPIPLNDQEAFMNIGRAIGNLPVSRELCSQVLSLPIHTEMEKAQQDYIIENIKAFFK